MFENSKNPHPRKLNTSSEFQCFLMFGASRIGCTFTVPLGWPKARNPSGALGPRQRSGPIPASWATIAATIGSDIFSGSMATPLGMLWHGISQGPRQKSQSAHRSSEIGTPYLYDRTAIVDIIYRLHGPGPQTARTRIDRSHSDCQ